MTRRKQAIPLCWAMLCAASLFSGAVHSADLLDKIKADKTITIATEARYAPFESVENGKIVGYDVDLMNHILQKNLPGVDVKQLDLPFQGILPGLDAKKFDFVVTAVTVNKQRMDHFAFTVPIAESTVALLKRDNDSSINSLDDLSGKVVGSQAGSGQLQVLQEFDKKLKASGKPGIKEIKQYVSFDEAYADLANQRLDGVAQSLANLGPLIKTRPGVFTTLKPMLGPTTYFGWVGRKGDDSAALVKLFSDGISEANRDGTMKALQQKWFGFVMDVPADQMPAPSL
ncbi:TPA: transporter substrate-binding domain-containing protein [Yersinia enterocolitica]|uniref:transporter substrate-binding domain-containing protein n=1 Tax=Yersinia enterocolitica TaxID=630 RepID=UPI00094BC25C|nr:transporter substrate-binding domain-containing protein [Yersinia enterocolitica]HDL8054302.1 transporter substrate-binding domain-containing protein [Yersinia enterocolitica]HDM8439857.1 transporter substrate-binding domain-containing protein [Yersinia enterocolitica]HEI6852182.1 transporter substrate-binding domain-containing protein [Yersinia enterocolitica]HEN3566402.1 transporter substrate-binding domain-containing protein [Yersinia enterocolitica]HEN3569672.1 transporter substrate-bin